jgi:hypothetical protein
MKKMIYGLMVIIMLMFYGTALADNTGADIGGNANTVSGVGNGAGGPGNGQGPGNGAGQGLGNGNNGSVVSPAPEPPIMVLLGGGALLGAYWLRKKSLISAAQTS